MVDVASAASDNPDGNSSKPHIYPVGEWSEWMITFKDKEFSVSPVTRLRFTSTSIKNGKTYFTVETKIKNKIDKRENIEIDLSVFFQRINNDENILSPTVKPIVTAITYSVLGHNLKGKKEVYTLRQNGENIPLVFIKVDEFEFCPVYIDTPTIEIKLLAFGKNNQPKFPIPFKNTFSPKAKTKAK